MNETTFTASFEQYQHLDDRKQEAYRIALALYKQNPDWVTYFREILGIGGVARRLFPEDKDLLEFEKTEEHAEIQLMLARLRQNSDNRAEAQEPTRVITVRLPKSLHEALQAQAHLHQTSMNKLCISKLLQVIDDEFAGQAIKEQEDSPANPQPSPPATTMIEKGEGDL